MLYWFNPLKKYATFTGRATRAEYWKFCFVVVLGMVLFIVLIIAGGFRNSLVSAQLGTIFSAIWILFTVIPLIAVGVRRLHDRGLSGRWMLIKLLPLVGGLVLLILFCLPGTFGMNKYGEDPR